MLREEWLKQLAEKKRLAAEAAAAKAGKPSAAPGRTRLKPGPAKAWPIKSIRATGRLARAGRSSSSARAAATYLALLVHLPKKSRTYVGTLVRLAAWLGLDGKKCGGTRTVSRALDDLVRVGLVSRTYTPQGKLGRVTIEVLDAQEPLPGQDHLPSMTEPDDGPECPPAPAGESVT